VVGGYVRKRVTLRISKGLRSVALAAGISRRVYSDTRVIFIIIIAIYIALAEKIGTPLISLLLLEEARCQAALRAARYQQGLRRYHSRHVRARTLEVGDLVLRRILSREGLHKLSPMWEGPFKVTRIARPGSARLETTEGVPVGNPWNIAHLRKLYP
jgi:hypothetical protein